MSHGFSSVVACRITKPFTMHVCWDQTFIEPVGGYVVDLMTLRVVLMTCLCRRFVNSVKYSKGILWKISVENSWFVEQLPSHNGEVKMLSTHSYLVLRVPSSSWSKLKPSRSRFNIKIVFSHIWFPLKILDFRDSAVCLLWELLYC